MQRYLLVTDFRSGEDETPMSEWEPAEVQAHLDYYSRLHGELVASGELLASEILTGPDLAKVVRADRSGAALVTDGPFGEFKEWLAGYQVVGVESEERALEIAARISAVPGRGSVPTGQPIQVRRLMDDGPVDAAGMDEYLSHAAGR